jgi:hypothetical protein
MPPSGRFPDCELNKLENWILKGIPYSLITQGFILLTERNPGGINL